MPSAEGPDGLRDEPATGYTVVDSRRVLRTGAVIDVRSDTVRMPDGSTAVRDVVVHPGAVGVVALDEQARVLLLGQYRHPVRQRLWEVPAGLLDAAGESPLDAARRELYEEAHLQAGRWNVLADVFTSPGMTDESTRLYLARDIAEAGATRFAVEAEEADLVPRWVDLDDAADAVAAGRLHNALAVVGILATLRARERGWRDLRPADAAWPEMSPFLGSRSTPADTDPAVERGGVAGATPGPTVDA